MPRLVRALPGVLLLTMGAGSVYIILSTMPAFNREARVTGLFEDWRVPITSALYNRSDYLFQVGFGLLQGDLVASAVTEGRDELASIETAMERARRGRLALEGSARLAPGNAYTWTFLGWAAAMEGDPNGAVSALETSWKLAPWSLQLAPVRLNLFEYLVEFGPVGAPLGVHIESARRDLEILRTHDLRDYEALTSDGGILEEISRPLRMD